MNFVDFGDICFYGDGMIWFVVGCDEVGGGGFVGVVVDDDVGIEGGEVGCEGGVDVV